MSRNSRDKVPVGTLLTVTVADGGYTTLGGGVVQVIREGFVLHDLIAQHRTTLAPKPDNPHLYHPESALDPDRFVRWLIENRWVTATGGRVFHFGYDEKVSIEPHTGFYSTVSKKES